MVKKVLITGISGFVGSHLAEYLLTQEAYSIYGTYLSESSLVNIASLKEKLTLTQIDLQDEKKVFTLIEEIKPDIIFHLAALSSVGQSFEKPAETIINNVVVQVNILEAVRRLKLTETKILIVTSADVYGKVAKEDIPIDEETKFQPANAYAISKITQDFLGLQYFISYKLKVIRARPFNHIGPRQATGFVIADWAQKIAKIEKGMLEPILRVGNLEAQRDFTDVRDMVKAYALLIEKGAIGDVYNIGSGVSHKIADVLTMLLSFSKVQISIDVEPQLLRPEDSPERVCDNRKFVQLTGWKPTISLETTLKETLDYWRQIV